MKEINKNIIISDENEIYSLQEEFDRLDKKIEEKMYVSLTEEKSRIAKVIIRRKIKFDLANVREELFKILANELHPNISYSDLKEGNFYRSSGKNGKVNFKLNKLNDNEMNISYFNKEQKFIKSIHVREGLINKKITRIRFLSYCKGMNSLETYFEKRIRDVYLQREKIAFKITFLKLKINLGYFSDKKIESVNKKIERMLSFSKKLY